MLLLMLRSPARSATARDPVGSVSVGSEAMSEDLFGGAVGGPIATSGGSLERRDRAGCRSPYECGRAPWTRFSGRTI
jgi:hypothetical protein